MDTQTTTQKKHVKNIKCEYTIMVVEKCYLPYLINKPSRF